MKEKLKVWKKFFHGVVIEKHGGEVRQRNYDNLKIFSFLGLVTMCFTTIFGHLMREVVTFNTEFSIMLAYFVLMNIITLCIKSHTKYITLIFYIWITPLMIISILMGTFLDPTQPSITIMVFLCILPLFILDKPWRIVTYISITSIIYVVCCFIAKTKIMFVEDMIDLVLFSVLSIGINCMILRDRMNNVEYVMRMKYISEIDALTKIYNRGAGEEKTKRLIANEERGMLMILDVDNFKSINDQYGHDMGDKVIKAIANKLKKTFIDDDIVMRLGGDEFAIYSLNIKDLNDANVYVKKLFEEIHSLSFPEMPDYKVTISLGGAIIFPKEKKSFEELYHESDNALYDAKKNGKGIYAFFNNKI